MNSVNKKIESEIRAFDKGKIFFVDYFSDIGSSEAVRQSLHRFTKSGMIVRVAQGIYCYPEIDQRFGLGVVYPSYGQIAMAIADHTHTRIAPTGEYAMNVLGLSTQVPMNYVYYTDGPSRFVKISNGRGITFKRTAPKNLAFSNRLAMLVTSALKLIGQGKVTDDQKDRIVALLRHESKETVQADLKLMPAWIRDIVVSAYN